MPLLKTFLHSYKNASLLLIYLFRFSDPVLYSAFAHLLNLCCLYSTNDITLYSDNDGWQSEVDLVLSGCNSQFMNSIHVLWLH